MTFGYSKLARGCFIWEFIIWGLLTVVCCFGKEFLFWDFCIFGRKHAGMLFVSHLCAGFYGKPFGIEVGARRRGGAPDHH